MFEFKLWQAFVKGKKTPWINKVKWTKTGSGAQSFELRGKRRKHSNQNPERTEMLFPSTSRENQKSGLI